LIQGKTVKSSGEKGQELEFEIKLDADGKNTSLNGLKLEGLRSQVNQRAIAIGTLNGTGVQTLETFLLDPNAAPAKTEKGADVKSAKGKP
jgi:hypothetical protein